MPEQARPALWLLPGPPRTGHCPRTSQQQRHRHRHTRERRAAPRRRRPARGRWRQPRRCAAPAPRPSRLRCFIHPWACHSRWQRRGSSRLLSSGGAAAARGASRVSPTCGGTPTRWPRLQRAPVAGEACRAAAPCCSPCSRPWRPEGALFMPVQGCAVGVAAVRACTGSASTPAAGQGLGLGNTAMGWWYTGGCAPACSHPLFLLCSMRSLCCFMHNQACLLTRLPCAPLPPSQPAAPRIERGRRAMARRPLLPQSLLRYPRPPAAAAVPCAQQRSVSDAASGRESCAGRQGGVQLSLAVAAAQPPAHPCNPFRPLALHPCRAASLWRPAVEAPVQLLARRGAAQLRVKVPAAYTNVAPVRHGWCASKGDGHLQMRPGGRHAGRHSCWSFLGSAAPSSCHEFPSSQLPS